MTAQQFKKEACNLFSENYLSTIAHETPEIVANKQLHTKFTALLKTLFKDCVIHTSKGCYCYDSAFIQKGEKFVYVSLSDLRFWHNWYNDILIRTAKNEKDYSGGMNNYTTIEKLQDSVYRLLSI